MNRRYSMCNSHKWKAILGLVLVVGLAGAVAVLHATCPIQGCTQLGQEVSIPVHLVDGQEFTMSTKDLLAFGQALFTAMWTSSEGQGRPMSKGTGNPLSDPSSPLVFPRNFNRISSPETNSCSG